MARDATYCRRLCTAQASDRLQQLCERHVASDLQLLLSAGGAGTLLDRLAAQLL